MTPYSLALGPAFVLASLLTGYPRNGFSQNVQTLFEDETLGLLPDDVLESLEGIRCQWMMLQSSPEGIDTLCSEYIDRFERGGVTNSLYETEYGRDRAMAKSHELVDIAGFYKAFGMELGEEGCPSEMLDHISIELEFYALLLLKYELLAQNEDTNGMEIVLDARQKFLKDHLGRFVSAICARPGVVESAFYSHVFSFVQMLVHLECRDLGVEPHRVHWIPGEENAPAMSCGGSVAAFPSSEP